jgi:hypothetical protein
LISDAFQVSGSCKVREATYLGMLFVRSAKPVLSVAVGQKLARPEYTLPPSRNASAARS